jgi:hypothetical protein
MVRQLSVTVRNARLDAEETAIGASAVLKLFTGAPPASCAAANTGVELATGILPSNWMGDASGGTKSLLGSHQMTAGAAGVAGHYRRYASGGTVCHEQGEVHMPVSLTTSATTAANSNVLTFANTTGVVAGMKVTSGTGVPTGTYVVAVTGTTVTLSRACPAGVGSGVAIGFGGDLTIQNTNLAPGQVVTISQNDVVEDGA